jgi:hypothetical protein
MRQTCQVCAGIAVTFALSVGRAQEAPSAHPTVKTQALYSKKGKEPTSGGLLVYFDRTKSERRQITSPQRLTSAQQNIVAAAIDGSMALVSGTVFISSRPVVGCWTRDWNIAVLSEEASNVINYHAGDVSVYCVPAYSNPNQPTPNPNLPPPRPSLDDANKSLAMQQILYVVLPVKAVWVEITGFHGNLDDPARKAPTQSFSAIPICYMDPTDDGATPYHTDDNDIRPCDLDQNLAHDFFYDTGWIYNRLTAPGVWLGSFTVSPAVIQHGTQSITEDIRFYGSTKAGPGWLGLNSMFEKSTTLNANLNSLTGALTYDFHLSNTPWWISPWKRSSDKSPFTSETSVLAVDQAPAGVGIRPGEFVISSGEEYAPTRTKGLDGEHEPKDLNVVEAIYYKQPISITAFKFPSFLTLFPTVGAEGGWHLIRYQSDEGARFFRKVAGMDASVRYPFQGAPNFTSTKPATVDFSFRERFLSGNEPYTDTFPEGNPSPPVTPILSRQRRSYYRIALNWPLSSYVAITTSVQRGSLPPDFYSVAWTLTAGLTFGSTGISEH